MPEQEKSTIKLDGKVSLNAGVELPIDGLPASIQRYIEAVCEVYHCPQEFVTTAVLTTASTAVGKKIHISEGKYKNMLELWFILVARSGSNKSYPIKLVTHPLRELDYKLYQRFMEQLKDYKSIPTKERTGDEPKCRAIVVDDCTDERRNEIMLLNSESAKTRDDYERQDSQRGAVGIFPEVKGMFDSRNMYQNGGTIGISRLLLLYDGTDIKVDRKGGPTMSVLNPFFNIIGDLQTELLKATFGSELFMTNGLNQRFLFCLAENIEYPKRSHNRLSYEITNQWQQTVNLLYEGIYHAPNGEHRTLFRNSDGEIILSEGADRLYDEYYNSLQEKKASAQTGYEASIYSKLQIQVLRYAGVVHALEVAEEKGERSDYNIVRESTMEYAIRCMSYSEAMAKRVYNILTEGGAPIKFTGILTKGDAIRSLCRFYPQVNRNKLAAAIGVSPAYISKELKTEVKVNS